MHKLRGWPCWFCSVPGGGEHDRPGKEVDNDCLEAG